MTEAYLDGLRVLYDGEVMGERLLLALHAAARTPREARCFAAILQLETETKARLRPLLLRHGLSLAETGDLSGIPARVAGYLQQSWEAYASATAARLGPILASYQAIAALGPPQDRPILQAVVDHEAALLRWAEMEGAGDTDASLSDLLSLLNFPPD